MLRVGFLCYIIRTSAKNKGRVWIDKNKKFYHNKTMKNYNIAVLKLGNLNIEVLDLYNLNLRKGITLYNHAHSFFEIHFVLEGFVKMNVNGKSYTIEKNNMFLLQKNCAHYCEERSQDFTACSICFDISYAGRGEQKLTHEFGYFSKLFYNQHFTILNFSSYDRSLLYNILENLTCFNVYSVYKVNTEATNLFLEISKKLSSLTEKSEKEEPSSVSNDQNSFRKNRIDQYFVKNIRGCSLEDLALFLHLSVRQTSRFLKKYYGKSFKELLIETRLRYAEPLVKENLLSIKEIAVKTGFRSTKRFIECYEAYFKTPLDRK